MAAKQEQEHARRGVEPVFLRVEEVAERAAISRATTYKLIAAGEMPASKIGKAIRIHVDDFAAWCASKRAATGGSR